MKTSVTINGMHCQGCVAALTGAFSKVPGVTDVRVTLDPPRAQIESSGPVALEDFERAARSTGSYSVSNDATHPMPEAGSSTEPRPSLYPLFLIVIYLAGAVAALAWARHAWNLEDLLNDFMAGFFLVFSFFKLLDLRGFAASYRQYDVVAKAWKPWGYAYPFVELALGVAYLVRWQPQVANLTSVILMLVGSTGVLRALLRKDQIRCACLGTTLNLPMTTVTLTEDLVMAAMGVAMLMLHR